LEKLAKKKSKNWRKKKKKKNGKKKKKNWLELGNHSKEDLRSVGYKFVVENWQKKATPKLF